MQPDPNAAVHRLFDELIALDHAARAARVLALSPDDAVVREVTSLLDVSERAGDFLGVLGTGPLRSAVGAGSGRMVAGRYRLERHLGSGAMGDVHLAWDEQLERRVALKFLRDSSSLGDPVTLARFRAEARAAARLDHPHVGSVYDVGDAADQLFIVMAYYPGETLRQRLARGPLPEREALRIAAQIASALAAAHSAGIVHRDVKPANVLFDAEGGARLTDFGIAKLLDDPRGSVYDVAAGTPAYMSPEQARGEAADPSADLWALGVMLDEMLTGQRPVPFGARANGDDRAAVDPRDDHVSSRDLIAALLAPERARRLTGTNAVRETLDRLAAALDVPSRATATLRGSLPNVMTSLVGREQELLVTHRLLADARLLTLTGPGGTGKTRLALELAGGVREQFTDGVWFVPLAEIAEAALVPSSIAQTLGVRDLGGMPLRDRTIAAVGTRRLLLVLDNFEHVLGAASFVADLLGACLELRILVTSRAPLGLQGEHVFPVPPLATPQQTDTDPAASAAVRLFVSRARAVRPSFALDGESLGAVAEICRRLDGLPLALELAAARAKLLSPRAILARLEQRFDLLRADAADRPVRHGTMRAVIDWSYILLTEAERALFCRLAVFSGGASFEAAEAVSMHAVDSTGLKAGGLDLLDSLCGKSLLHAEEQPDGEPRFVMLETIREYGLDRLGAGPDAATARSAHRAYFVVLAERAASHLRGPEQVSWLDRLEREYANFRVALDGALAEGADGLTDAACLAVALHRLWLTRGPLFDGIDYLRRILHAVDARGAPVLGTQLMARVISAAAHLAGTRSVFPEARDLFARSLELYRAADDRPAIAATLNNLAWQLWNVGDLSAGAAMSMEAMTIHQELGDELGVALSRNNLAWIAMERGDLQQAERHFEAVIASHKQRGDARAAAFAMSWLGVLASKRGDLRRAVSLHEQALAVGDPVADLGYRTLVLVRLGAARHALRDSDDEIEALEAVHVPALRAFGRLWPLGYGLTELGAMLLDRGETARALAVLDEALEARYASGGAGGVIETQILLGAARHRARDHAGAVELLGRALDGAREYGSSPLVITCLETIAHVALEAAQPELAVTLLCAATQARKAHGLHRSPRQQIEHAALLSTLANALGDARHADALAEGLTMPLAAAASRAAAELQGEWSRS